MYNHLAMTMDVDAPTTIEKVLPLTPLQSGILFINATSAPSEYYMEQLRCQVEGRLIKAAAERAYELLGRRYEALRTTFMWQGVSEPVQIVHRYPVVDIKWFDASQMGATEQANYLVQLSCEEHQRAFDLRHLPLSRLAIVTMSADDHRVIWTHHHIIIDGWSVGLVVAEWLKFYEALVGGLSALVGSARSIDPFFKWLAVRDRQRALEFWRNALVGAVKCERIPPERALPTELNCSRKFGRQTVEFTGTDFSLLTDFAANNNWTVFTLICAAWGITVGIATGSKDIIFGTTMSGRHAEIDGVEEMVGLLINTVPFRVRIHPRQKTTEWLDGLEQLKNSVQEYSFLPLSEILRTNESFKAERTALSSLLVLENYPVPREVEIRNGGVRLRNIECHARTEFDVAVTVVPRKGGLTLTVDYDWRRYGDEEMNNLLKALVQTAKAISQSTHVGDALCAGQPDISRVLNFGRGGRGHAKMKPWRLEDCFQDMAKRGMDSIALTFGQRHWTYGFLSRMASNLCVQLRHAGVAEEDRVGVCIRRGPWFVAATLGVMEAGACYVPMDPDWPAERMQFILKDAGCKAVLVDIDGRGVFQRSSAVELTVQDALSASNFPLPNAQRSCVKTGRGTAYIMYTSGSTGRPKGVMIEHCGVVNRIRWMQNAYSLGKRDRVLHKTPTIFDVSVWEIFWPLMVGARLVIARPGGHRDVKYLSREIRRHRIGTIHFVPSMLRVWLGADGLAVSCLQGRCWLDRVICSGEELATDLVVQFQRAVKSLYSGNSDQVLRPSLHNLYGPTEASIDVTAWSVPAEKRETGLAEIVGDDLDARETSKSVPIGFPIDGIAIYILDHNLRPVRAGAVGELCISGVGLARGYVGRGDLTAERYVPNPFVQEPFDERAPVGGRMYRTGDLARWKPDKTIEFLGRIDRQLKVNGVRIEPGEIESTMRLHPSIENTAITVCRSGLGDSKYIVMYVAVRPTEAVDWPTLQTELFRWAREKLPRSHVPTALVRLPGGIPLTDSGKLDLTALPQPSLADCAGCEPSDAWVSWNRQLGSVEFSITEKNVAELWVNVLGSERAPEMLPTTKFFSLGGDSLNSLHIASRLAMRYQIDLPITRLMENPSITELASHIDRLVAERGTPVRMEVESIGQCGQLVPLSSAQKRLWYINQATPNGVQHNSICAVRLLGQLDRGALLKALNALIDRHDSLRTKYCELDGAPMQSVIAVDPIILSTRNVSGSNSDVEEQYLRCCAEERLVPFDLRTPPLFRAVLLKHSEHEHGLIIVIHHIACDGWSAGILIRDIRILYESYSTGREPVLPRPAMHYVEFAQWEASRANAGGQKSSIAYWLNQLHGLPSAIRMTSGEPTASSPDRAELLRWSSTKMDPHVLALQQTGDASRFMVMVAGWALALHDLTGRTDIVLGADVADRPMPQTWDVVGLFVNQIVLRIDLCDDPQFSVYLKRVREVCLGAYLNQGVPFNEVLRVLRQSTKVEGGIFNIKLVEARHEPDAYRSGSLLIRRLPLPFASDEFDLIVNYFQFEGQICVETEFKPAAFPSASVSMILQRMEQLLVQAASNQALRISEIRRACRSWSRSDERLSTFARMRRQGSSKA